MLPHGLAKTWVWLGPVLVVGIFMARYVIRSRQFGRSPKPLLILIFPAVVVGGALLSHSNSRWQFLVLLLVPAFFAWAWFRRDTTKLELDDCDFAAEMSAEVINPPSPIGLQAKGRVRVLVGDGMILTRSRKFPSWADNFGMLNRTFRATDCEVDRPHMGVSSFAITLGKPSIVLRGTDSRGHEVELALSRPGPAGFAWNQPTLEDVQSELIRAGARAAGSELDQQPGRLGPLIKKEPPAANYSPRKMGDQPPFWPPPPGWSYEHETPAGRRPKD